MSLVSEGFVKDIIIANQQTVGFVINLSIEL